MRDIFSVAARGNTAIYTLDPRGLAPSEFGAADSGRAPGRSADPPGGDRFAADHRGRDRRPGHRRQERSAAGSQADGPGPQCVLSAGLHVVARAAGRQVPRDSGAGEPEGRRGPRAQGLLGLLRGRNETRVRTAEGGAARGSGRRARQAGHRASSRRAGTTWCCGWARSAARPNARKSRSCGKRRRAFRRRLDRTRRRR